MSEHSKFSTDLKALGFDVDASDVIEKLDTDQLLNLLDAIGNKNRDAIRQIIGAEHENEAQHDNDGEKDVDGHDDEKDVEDQADEDEEEEEPLNSLLRKKEHLKADKKDKKNKRILRKSTEMDEESSDDSVYNIGDNVAVDGEEATVKIPRAPGNTVGVLINGELKMVDKKKVHKLDEGVLGMTDMPGLKRMQELAGIPTSSNPVSMPHEYPADDMGLGGEVREGDDFGDVHDDMGADLGDDMGHDDMGDMGGEADLPGVGDDMGAPLPPPVPGTPEVPAAPLAAGPVPMGAPPAPMGGMPSPGSALEDAAALDQAISDIEALIPNTKISDYKQVVARLEALVALAKSTGKSALSESSRGVHDRLTADAKMSRPGVKAEAPKASVEAPKVEFGKRKRPGSEIEEDRLSTIRNARDIVAKGHEDHHDHEEQGDEGVDSENVPGRKTLMDYMNEVNETQDYELETLGANRADAVRSLQARMGAGTTPQDAGAAFDAMVKDGGIKQRGSAFQMTPMSDAQVKVDTGAMNNGGNSAANSTADSSTTGSNTTNPGANVQGSANGAYQGR